MIDILIIDDDNERIRTIAAEINGEGINLEHVMTKNEALCKLEEKEYDLVIIDIMLPERLDCMKPQKTAGIDIINDIEQRIKIYQPRSIVGITSSNETYEDSKGFFDEKLIPILIWNPNDDLWRKQLSEKIKYLKLNKTHSISVDTAIITTVPEEFESVKSICENWRMIEIDNDPTTYFIADIKTKIGNTKRLLLTKSLDMGMTAASNSTTKVILNFKPKQVFMTGICGGIKGEVELCDIIVATQTWDYGSGKIKPKDDQGKSYYKFETSARQINLKPEIVNAITYSGDEILKRVVKRWNDANMDKPIRSKLHLSPMPSGASVICDPTLFNEIIKPQHRKCKGLDMETYGVYFSVQNTSKTPIDFISIKAVSDFADTEKSDDYHDECCYLSANFLKECLYNEVL